MKHGRRRIIGKVLIGLGILLLLVGILLTLTIDPGITWVFLTGSIVINSVGITLLRMRDFPGEDEED